MHISTRQIPALIAGTVIAISGCGGSDDDAGRTTATGAASATTAPVAATTASTIAKVATTEPVATSAAISATTAAPAPSDTSSATAATLLDGTYVANVTAQQMVDAGVAAGFPESHVVASVFGDGLIENAELTIRIAEGGWSMIQAYDGNPGTVGWRGAYHIVDDHTVVAGDDCPITYGYTFVGDVLTIDLIEDTCPGEGEQIAQTVLYETAPFTRVDTSGTATTSGPSSYSSQNFVVPFTVTLPAWLSADAETDESNFVTWEATDADRAVRVLAPVNLYPPGAATPTPLPADYVDYLLGLSEQGVNLDDQQQLTIDGHPATLVTISTDHSVDGAEGCPAEGMTAEDCYGPQPDVDQRFAVVDVDGQTLLIWLRTIHGTDATAATRDFEQMLSTIQFG